MRTYEMIKKLRDLVNEWYKLDLHSYTFWKENSFKVDNESKLITMIYKIYNDQAVTDVHKNKILRQLNNAFKEATLSLPSIDELWFEDSLQWLFCHYPYSNDDNSNCVLINGEKDVLGVSYTNSKQTKFIYSKEAISPWYTTIRINWSNKEWTTKDNWKKNEVEKLLSFIKKTIWKN